MILRQRKNNEDDRTITNYIRSDIYRYYGSSSPLTCVKAILFNKTARLQCILRLCQGSGLVGAMGGLLYTVNRTRKTICIPKGTKIGFGLYIGHNGPVVINPTAIIGNNVNLSQFTIIGSNHDHAAKIGDDVYIGPNVCIVEDVSIGNGATIGVGSVVTKNIPPNATAAGNYAKVLNYNNPGSYIKNRWIVKHP